MSNCPRLAGPEPDIITINNADVLKLTNHNTFPGSVTQISCLGYPEYILIGPKSLKCLSSGNWNDTIPRCVAERFVSSTSTTEESDPTKLIDSDISMLPIICVAVLLALVFLVLVILVACTVRFWKKPKSPPTDASTSERNSHIRRSEPNLYSRPPAMLNTRQYADSWDSVSVDFDRRDGAVPEGNAGYDYLYNGSTVTAINSNASNGRSNYRNSSPKHWSNSFPSHAHREPKQVLQKSPYPYY